MDYIDKLVEQCCEILKKSKTEEEQRYWISAHIFQINIQYSKSKNNVADNSNLKSQHRIFLEKLKLELQDMGLYEKGDLEKIINDCMIIFA